MTTWYNWETIKIINGQKKKLGKVTFTVGVLTILFALILVVDSILKFRKFMDLIKIRDTSGVLVALILLPALEFAFATTIILHASWTLAKYVRPANTAVDRLDGQ